MRHCIIIVALLAAACGPDDRERRRRDVASYAPAPSDIPNAPGEGAGPVTGDTTAGDVTAAVALAAPDLPAGAAELPLTARLAGGGRAFTLSSATGGGGDGTPVPAGTYTLTYLDQAGAPSGVTQTVAVASGQVARIPVGAVWVSPASAVQSGRTGTQALPYRIAVNGQTLRTVVADLNTVVHVPGEATEWFPVGSGGELEPLTFETGAGLVTREWGSVFVRRDATDDVVLRGASGVTLFDETADGVEYLLPAEPQGDGCRVYQALVNQLTVDVITLCDDAVLHVELNAR